MLLDPLQSLAIHSRFKLQNIEKPLILTLRISLQPSQQLNSSPHAMRKIRPSRNRNDFTLELVLALPRFRLASLGAISDFPASSAGFGIDMDVREAQCCCLLALGFRGTSVETPGARVLQALGV